MRRCVCCWYTLSLAKKKMNSEEEFEELHALREEFRWVLREEVHSVLQQLLDTLKACSKRFLDPNITGNSSVVKPEKFILANTNGLDNIKGVVTVCGDSVVQADLTLKLPRNSAYIMRTFIRNDMPWKLQQVQDTGNHLNFALECVSSVDEDREFSSSEEVMSLMDRVMSHLRQSRSCLLSPTHFTLEQIYRSKNRKVFYPPLPGDTMVHFSTHYNKLVMNMYFFVPQLGLKKPGHPSGEGRNPHMLEIGKTRFELAGQQQVECCIPWLDEVLATLTTALQLCQQLKDKISVFSTYQKSMGSNLLTC